MAEQKIASMAGGNPITYRKNGIEINIYLVNKQHAITHNITGQELRDGQVLYWTIMKNRRMMSSNIHEWMTDEELRTYQELMTQAWNEIDGSR